MTCRPIELSCRPGLSVRQLESQSNVQAENIAVAHDMTGRRRREMGADDEHRLIGISAQHFLARGAGGVLVKVGTARPIGPRHLTGMVHEVAGDQGFLAARRNVNADMARCMAGNLRQRRPSPEVKSPRGLT